MKTTLTILGTAAAATAISSMELDAAIGVLILSAITIAVIALATWAGRGDNDDQRR